MTHRVDDTAELIIRRYHDRQKDRRSYPGRPPRATGLIPGLVREKLMVEMDISNNAAAKYVNDLVEAGMLVKVGTGSGQTIYLADELAAEQEEKARKAARREALHQRLLAHPFRYEPTDDEPVIRVPVSMLCAALGIDNPYDEDS